MENTLLIAIGALALFGGGMALGYWVGNGRRWQDDARSSAVRSEYEQYRRKVTEHFSRTADHFQAIGRQYRELYEHMATGAESLCDDRIESTPKFPRAEGTEELRDRPPEERPRDFAEGSDAEEPAEAAVADTVTAAPPEADDGGKPESVEPENVERKAEGEAAPEKRDPAGERTYH